MAASGTTRPRSGGFFKLYMFIWAIAAAAALAYLASLVTAPDLPKALQQQTQNEPDQSTRLASRALSEVGTIRRSVAEMQRDVTQMKENFEQRDAAERQLQSRLSVIEERVSTLATPPVATNTVTPSPKQKAVDKSKAKEKGTDRSTSRLSRLETEEEKTPEEEPAAQPRVETGSILPPPHTPGAPVVTFGAPVVTPTKAAPSTTTYAVQIGAGTSLDALRHSWTQLSNKHAALQGLQPRYAQPKVEGGKYRLMAGPFSSKAEAEKACADMGVGKTGCFSTSFGGEPL